MKSQNDKEKHTSFVGTNFEEDPEAVKSMREALVVSAIIRSQQCALKIQSMDSVVSAIYN